MYGLVNENMMNLMRVRTTFVHTYVYLSVAWSDSMI